MIRPRLMGFATAAIALVLAPALAQVPAAMDRVPSDAGIVISVKNISKLKAGIDSLAKSLGVPAEQMQGLMKVGEVLNMQGADADGSAALGLIGGGEGDEPEGVAVVPVRDYAAFVKNFGATGAGVEEIKLDEKPMYVKNLEGGFAAVSSNKTLVEKFGGKPGNGKSHETLMGATGKAIAESSDIIIVANIGKMGDQIKGGVSDFKDQMQMGMAMMGNGANDLSGLDKFMEGFIRDASAGIIGFRINDSGVTLDAGAHFKEGSDYGKYFASKGNASQLIAKLPNQAFLFAMAMDTSSPSIRSMIKDIQAFAKSMQPAGQEGGAPNMLPADFSDKSDGLAFQLGNSPAPMGGLFLNTVAYLHTSKPAELAKSMKEQMTAQNGKTIAGTTFTTSYEEGVKAGSITADAWSLKMQGDPEDPQAQMVNQMNFMLFGPGGLNGYTAQTEGGLIMTYSKNSELLSQTLASSKGGENMTADAEVKKIAGALPSGRTFEAYIGVKSLLDTVFGLLAPMGVVPQVEIPDQVPPVGMGATTDSGGLRFTIVVPTGVITTVKSIAEAMDQGGGEGDKDKGAGQPKF
jgi:hypothetical protein